MDKKLQKPEVEIDKGSLDGLKVVMELFDKFDPAKNYTVPITDSDF